MAIRIDRYKFERWKRTVYTGIEKVVEGIGKESKRILKEREESGEERKFQEVENSWFSDSTPATIKSIHTFGFDHPEAILIEHGGPELKESVQVKGGVVGQTFTPEQIVDVAERPFLSPAIQEYMGTKSAGIIIRQMEESGLDER